MRRRWLIAALLLLAVPICAMGAFDHARRMNAPPAAERLDGRGAPPRLARRVVWVLVDGLRADAAERMPTLRRLGGEGAWLPATSELPTFSIPNYVAMATGVEPEWSGVRMNSFQPPLRLQTIADVVGAERSIAVTQLDWLGRVLPPPVLQHGVPLGFEEAALRALAAPERELVVIHDLDPDYAGHRHGGASPEYTAAVAEMDSLLDRWSRMLDPSRDALIITSDHGHLDRGGHGGDEPEVRRVVMVLWGAGVPRGLTGQARNRDVAPTIASLLGRPAPVHSRGRDLLARAPALTTVPSTVAPLLEGRPVTVALLALVVLAAMAMLLQRSTHPARSALVAVTAPALFTAGFFLIHTMSFSTINGELRFIRQMLLLGLLAAVGALLLGRLLRLRLAASVTEVTLLAWLLTTLPLLYAVARTGLVDPVRGLPGPVLQFLPVVAFSAVGAIAAGGGVMLIIAGVVTRRRESAIASVG